MALVQIGGENLTVSSTVKGPTATEVTDEVVMAEFLHKSGGDIFMQAEADPTASGTNGDFPAVPLDRWRIWGHDEVQSFLMIRQGATDAEIAAQYFGTGKT